MFRSHQFKYRVKLFSFDFDLCTKIIKYMQGITTRQVALRFEANTGYQLYCVSDFVTAGVNVEGWEIINGKFCESERGHIIKIFIQSYF